VVKGVPVRGSWLGRVAEFGSGLRWRVLFPAVEHEAASGYLRGLAASDCADSTLRSYAFDLLRWFRFLHRRGTLWERAERVDVRGLVEWLRAAPNPQRLRRRAISASACAKLGRSPRPPSSADPTHPVGATTNPLATKVAITA